MRSFLQRIRRFLQPFAIRLARFCGSDIVDYRTGRVIGRGLLIAFRGRVYVFGLREVVVPVFAPQTRVTYWRQAVVFTVHPPPDFPHEAAPDT